MASLYKVTILKWTKAHWPESLTLSRRVMLETRCCCPVSNLSNIPLQVFFPNVWRFHRRSQDFLWGALLLDQKSDDLFLVITLLFYVVIYVIYCHQLPFYLICGGAPHQIQPHFCLIPTKMPRNFFSSPWEVHLHPLHPYGYAYGRFQTLLLC